MKKLFLLRHAKSLKDDSNLEDHERTLNDRGFEEAPLTGKYLFTNKDLPDLIICSTALRAKQTLELILKELNKNIKVIYDKKIYDEDAKTIFKLISKTDNLINTLMIVGHNPDITHILELAIREEFPYDNFSTSGLAIIKFNINSWDEINLHKGELISFTTPKSLEKKIK